MWGMTPSPLQWTLVSLLIVIGVLLAAIAWRLAAGTHQASAESSVLSGVGGGLITGFAVSLSVFFLQNSFERGQEEATWRANVELAPNVPGFTPHHHSIKDISFTGKDLSDADFSGRPLAGYSFRDAKLHGANFEHADLKGVDFTGADLSEASLKNANLQGAWFLSTRMYLTDLTGAHYKDTQANYLTCWPSDFFKDAIRSHGLRPMKKREPNGHMHGPDSGHVCSA